MIHDSHRMENDIKNLALMFRIRFRKSQIKFIGGNIDCAHDEEQYREAYENFSKQLGTEVIPRILRLFFTVASLEQNRINYLSH